ncbi:MAG: hypothetical protein LBB10_01425 [Bifidobacteriaceae bacterium]|jgi:hypothetical protein|nr:hypothetical protein [Bifidobacteriaceae bacterium]
MNIVFDILASFFAGAFITNFIPHFVQGICGRQNQVPWSKNASAQVNVCWGTANLIIGLLIIHFTALPLAFYTVAAAILGGFVLALRLAKAFAKTE